MRVAAVGGPTENAFVVVVTELPERVDADMLEQVLDSSMEMVIDQIGGKVRSQRSLTIQGHSARELVVHIEGQGTAPVRAPTGSNPTARPARA